MLVVWVEAHGWTNRSLQLWQIRLTTPPVDPVGEAAAAEAADAVLDAPEVSWRHKPFV